MTMGKLEKRFVNDVGHSRGVARHAARTLRQTTVQPEQMYLDVGCGNGVAPIYVAKTFGLHVTGVDVDPQQIALAKTAAQSVPNIRFLCIDGRNLPFADGEFDVVFSNKVTHHIPNWRDALAEMVRVLKPGGYLLYADLRLPAALARLGKAVAGNRYGFPNLPAIDHFVMSNGLTAVYQSIGPLQFAGVFRKE